MTLLTEPEAAAVHYAQQERVPAGAVIAVYDFGGGTFDATILRKTEDGFEQLGRPEGMERLGGIDFDEALFTRRDGQVRAAGADGRPERPGDARRHRPPARGMPPGQGGPLVRHRHDDPGRAARPPDRDAPDPRGIRGDDPAADHRDDRGARPGGQECRPRVRRGRSHPPGRRDRRASRSSRRWSARRPAARSRSTRTRSTRWRSGRPSSPSSVGSRRRRTARRPAAAAAAARRGVLAVEAASATDVAVAVTGPVRIPPVARRSGSRGRGRRGGRRGRGRRRRRGCRCRGRRRRRGSCRGRWTRRRAPARHRPSKRPEAVPSRRPKSSRSSAPGPPWPRRQPADRTETG